MERHMELPLETRAVGRTPGERRRTIVALVSASVISMLVWGLIVALHVQ
ncbi:MAG TPA: hypothetical protein VHL80_18695 [Polyangia bacterium]|nr:hypothetical protein [Polyangia bacterium]